MCYCVKSVRIRSFSGAYFPAVRPNTERYSVNLRIQPNAGKYGPEKLRIRALFLQLCLFTLAQYKSKYNINYKMVRFKTRSEGLD